MNDSMEITQELQALPTESSHQPPPIPLVPPTPNSSPLTAPPPPPSNLEPSAKTTEGRQTLKPVAPSKRPTIERPTQNCRNEFNIENAFLPKELAEIIAARQRRERAWHVRVMICTTVLSNIDSTLANLVEDTEKEEAEAFKAYLRLAISNFASADSSSSPPRVPIQTRPS